MGRKRKNRPIRMYFAGYLHPGEDDDLIAWYQSLQKGKRFGTLVTLLRSGGAIGEALEADSQAAEAAVDKLFENLVVE